MTFDSAGEPLGRQGPKTNQRPMLGSEHLCGCISVVEIFSQPHGYSAI